MDITDLSFQFFLSYFCCSQPVIADPSVESNIFHISSFIDAHLPGLSAKCLKKFLDYFLLVLANVRRLD